MVKTSVPDIGGSRLGLLCNLVSIYKFAFRQATREGYSAGITVGACTISPLAKL